MYMVYKKLYREILFITIFDRVDDLVVLKLDQFIIRINFHSGCIFSFLCESKGAKKSKELLT